MFLYFKHIFNGLGSWFSSHGQLKVLIWESSEERWGPLESVAGVLFCHVSSFELRRSSFAPHTSCCAVAKLAVGEEQRGPIRKLSCTHPTGSLDGQEGHS